MIERYGLQTRSVPYSGINANIVRKYGEKYKGKNKEGLATDFTD